MDLYFMVNLFIQQSVINTFDFTQYTPHPYVHVEVYAITRTYACA